MRKSLLYNSSSLLHSCTLIPPYIRNNHALCALRHPFSRSLLSTSLEMASVTAPTVNFSSVSCLVKQNQASNLKKTSLSFSGKAFQSRRLPALRFRVACAAKPETVDKVVDIVRKQLALAEDRVVNGESKFSTLGADSLDTVEIVMGLEEEFGICVEEESAQSISTVQEAADLIETLLEKKC